MLERVDQIDFNELYELLLDASRKAFRGVQERHPDETFYAFTLYYDILDGIAPASNSEESHWRFHDHLTETDRDNKTLEWFYTRWNFHYWSYYRWGDEYFTSVSKWIEDNLFQFHGIGYEEEIAAQTTVEDAVVRMCLKVLKVLDEEHLFGQGEAREKVVLNIISDDYGEVGEINYVYLLNPLSTYERWCIETELYQHAQAFLDW